MNGECGACRTYKTRTAPVHVIEVITSGTSNLTGSPVLFGVPFLFQEGEQINEERMPSSSLTEKTSATDTQTRSKNMPAVSELLLSRRCTTARKTTIHSDRRIRQKTSSYKDICLCGGPAKNKVDHKIQKDARKYMQNSDIDIICIATSDKGFRCLANDAAMTGKKLYFIGEDKAPVCLRSAGTKFITLK